MTARSCLSSPMRPRQSKSSRMSASESALRLAGRFSVTTATDPSVSKPRFSYSISCPPALMPAVLWVVLIVSDPLRELGAHLAERVKVGVELHGDHALVLPVVVTEDIAPALQTRSSEAEYTTPLIVKF